MLPSGTSQLRRLPTFLLALAATLAAAFSLGAITAQADVGGEVSVTTEGAGRTDYWTAGSDGHVYERTLTDRWSDWADLGAPDGVGLASAPFVLHIPDNSPATQRGKYFIFALGGDHAMWLKTYTPGSGWSGWVDQQYGQFSTGFTASYSSGGDWINVVGADMSGNLVWRVYNQGSRTGLGGTTTNTLGRLAYPPAFLDWHTAAGAQRADVFGVNTSGQVWTATNSNLVWSPASVMLQPPGLTGQLATATNDAGKALIAARDQDRVTAVVNWSTDGTFGAWQSLGGMMGTAPSVHYSLTAAGQAHWQLVARDGGVPLGTDPGTGTPTGCHADVYLRPAQIVVRDRYGTDGWGEWHGISPTPGAPFYGTSHHFGGDDSQPGDHGLCGVIDTPDEIANVVAAIRGGSPQDAQTAIDGINPANGERDRVLAAVREADTNATVSVTHSDADHLDLWVERAGSVYVRSWESGTGWHDWLDLEAPVAAGVSAAPDAIRTPDGRLQVFVTGRDDKLYMKMLYPPGFPGHAEGWTDWTLIANGPFAPGVQAAWSNGGDWIDVVTRTKADNKLDWLHWTAGGNAWIENVRNDDGNTRLSVTPSVVDWTRDGSNLPEADVFAKDANGDAMWTINTNLAWSPWQSLTQGARSPIDAAVGDNRIIVAQLGSNGASAIGESYTPGGDWEGWDYSLGGNLSSAPTVNYWPDSDGHGRWELFGRDAGSLAGGRPGQIVYNERPDGSSWTGWVGITHLPGTPFYGTSTQFGNGDGINTQAEIDAAASAIRSASAIVADSMLDGITPGDERDNVWRAAFPVSWECGDDTYHSVISTSQIDCVLNLFDNGTVDADAQNVLDGLSKDNLKRVNAALKARVRDSELVRDVSDGQVYLFSVFSGGAVQRVNSREDAARGRYDYDAAKRISHTVLLSWVRGPDWTPPPEVTDPDDSLTVGGDVPQAGDQEVNADSPLSADDQAELDQILADEQAEDTAQGNLASPPAARSFAYPPNGSNNLPYTCRGTWAPIQADVSGFVMGNCAGGTAVDGFYTYVDPNGYPGARSEGRGWEAVSFPPEAHFDACGWMNIKNRLTGVAGTPPPNRCASGSLLRGPTFTNEAQYIKRTSGTRVSGSYSPPNSTRYRDLYVWARRFIIRGVPHEAKGYKYVPRHDCTAYANINPYKSGQQVLASERMWTVHARSANLRIRYMARYRARKENGDLSWWVMSNSINPSDQSQAWGFISADCLFAP